MTFTIPIPVITLVDQHVCGRRQNFQQRPRSNVIPTLACQQEHAQSLIESVHDCVQCSDDFVRVNKTAYRYAQPNSGDHVWRREHREEYQQPICARAAMETISFRFHSVAKWSAAEPLKPAESERRPLKVSHRSNTLGATGATLITANATTVDWRAYHAVAVLICGPIATTKLRG